jgi:dihydrolipoamide dehydrogenase
MRLEGTVDDLTQVIHAHPTLTEAVLEAAHAAAHGMAIHI